jgi:hypothetical protein
MKKLLIAIGLMSVAALAAAPLSCGGDNGINLVDGGGDGTDQDGNNIDNDGASTLTDGGGNDGGWNGPNTDGGPPTCLKLGFACKASNECCTSNCVQGSCQPPICVSDGLACGQNTDCCSGTCTGGKCAALSNKCKTLGNSCKVGSDCCSSYCLNGTCSQSSYCGQTGDICTQGSDCCGGSCTIAMGKIFGICSQPQAIGAQCSLIDGLVCGGTSADGGVTYVDGGLPLCGGACCSRACAPWGPTGVLVCQPASGCHPVGNTCVTGADCCGGTGMNPTVQCNKANPNDPLGVCSNPQGCKPNGDICRLKTNQCNATDNCCSGNVQQFDTCKQDNNGVPRCSFKKGDPCVPSNGACSSSADCCNLYPCVPNPNGNPPFTCYPQPCVPSAGDCTTDADCCVGNHCYIQQGLTKGKCYSLSIPDGGVADGGTPCALYDQLCSVSGDCCNGVPCNNGHCVIPPPN